MILVEGFPRCGSTTLTHLLNLHRDINLGMEPFHPKRYQGAFYGLAMQYGVEKAFPLMAARWNGFKHVWEPMNDWPFKGRPDQTRKIFECCDRIVTIRRKNLLQQIVSGHVSRHLRFWVGTREEFLERLNRQAIPPLSVAEATQLIEAALCGREQRRTWLDAIQADVHEVVYEDFFPLGGSVDSGVDRCFKIFDFLGVARPDRESFAERAAGLLAPEKYKWSDETVYLRVPGIESVERQCANEDIGFLFR